MTVAARIESQSDANIWWSRTIQSEPRQSWSGSSTRIEITAPERDGPARPRARSDFRASTGAKSLSLFEPLLRRPNGNRSARGAGEAEDAGDRDGWSLRARRWRPAISQDS